MHSHVLKLQTREFSGRAPDCTEGIRDPSDVAIESAFNTRNDFKNDMLTFHVTGMRA